MVGFGDNIGSGFQKIMKAWKTLGYCEPDIHEETDVNVVWLTLPLNSSVNDTANDTVNDHDHVNGTVNDGVNDFDHVNDHVNDALDNLTSIQKDILCIITENPSASFTEICSNLGISISTVTRATRHLKKVGIIRRTGSDKNGKWEII